MQAGDVYTVEVIHSASFRGPRRMPPPKASVSPLLKLGNVANTPI